jgi:glycosyltransferase involved in cell wall biosynthesis
MISIIIPCYNVEKTLAETLESVINNDFEQFEAIKVNDGSTDNTQKIIEKWTLKDKRFTTVYQPNAGLGAARNRGLQSASFDYVLPLDADNLLIPGFIEKALERHSKNNNLAVVYGQAELFGDKSGLWSPGNLEVFRMLNYNYIDACSLIKKKCLEKIGGYEENLPYQGHEDWDVWLGFIENGFEFEFLKMPAFKYRVSGNSMIAGFDEDMKNENIYYIKDKHKKLYFDNYKNLYFAYVSLRNEKNSKPIITKFFNRITNKLKS